MQTNSGITSDAPLIENKGKLTLEHGAVACNNQNDDENLHGRGGAIESKGLLIMNGGEISGNFANDGGGIYGGCSNDCGGYHGSESSKIIINGGKITGNYAKSRGGGILGQDFIVMRGGEISNNYSGWGGSGIYSHYTHDNSTVEISGGKIINNRSGGIYFACETQFFFYGGEVYGNDLSCTDIGGAICYGSNRSLKIKGNIYMNGPDGIYIRNQAQITGVLYQAKLL